MVDVEGPPQPAEYKESWFDKMEGTLLWKVIPPELSNPYTPMVSDKTLQEWYDNPISLRKACAIKVLCDGFEVLYLKNLVSPMIRTDHPCVSQLSFADILGYIARSAVHKRIEEDLARVRIEIEKEIAKRRAVQKSRSVFLPQKKEKKKKDGGQKKPAAAGQSFRIIRG